MPDVPDPEAAERERRLDALDRRRRGRKGTVETGFRGVLTEQDRSGGASGTSGKSYLGE
jgi:hypothetical protein